MVAETVLPGLTPARAILQGKTQLVASQTIFLNRDRAVGVVVVAAQAMLKLPNFIAKEVRAVLGTHPSQWVPAEVAGLQEAKEPQGPVPEIPEIPETHLLLTASPCRQGVTPFKSVRGVKS
jgi:hypothetical protein